MASKTLEHFRAKEAWKKNLGPEQVRRFDAPPTHAFCEPVWVGSNAPWCIRSLPEGEPLMPGGGVQTGSLCGRVRPRQGWDVIVPVTEDRLPNACPRCVSRITANDTKLSVGAKVAHRRSPNFPGVIVERRGSWWHVRWDEDGRTGSFRTHDLIPIHSLVLGPDS